MRLMSLVGLEQDQKQLNSADALNNFFYRVHDAYCLAAERGEKESYQLRLGGYRIGLEFTSEALTSKILPALEHLLVNLDGPSDLKILLWDSGSSNVEMPSPPWNIDNYSPRAEISGFSNERFLTAYHLGVNALSMLDQDKNLAIYWVRDAAQIPYYESAAPLRIILNWWLSNNQRLFVHAAAVGMPDGGVLITGKSGSGKSTTALACLFSDLFYTADDYCIVSEEEKPIIYGIYNIAKKDYEDIERVPQAIDALWKESGRAHEKAIYKIYEKFPQRILESFPLRAILVPDITHQSETRLEPISAVSALAALAPTTILQQPLSGKDILGRLARMVKNVPTYGLLLGTDTDQIPETISRFLKEIV